MCLAIPGKILSMAGEAFMRTERLICFVSAAEADRALVLMHAHPLGHQACIRCTIRHARAT